MGVVFDAESEYTSGAGDTTGDTWAHVTGPTANYMLCLVTKGDGTAPDVCTYAGVDMAVIYDHSYTSGGHYINAVLYGLKAPAIGNNNVTVTLQVACPNAIVVVTYCGVDSVTPYGTLSGPDEGVKTSVSLVVASSEKELVLGFISVRSDNGGITVGADQTDRGEASGGTGLLATTVTGQISEEVGAASTTMTESYVKGHDDFYCCVYYCINLLPLVVTRGRSIAYTFDIWDPLQRILDTKGESVAPWDVKADRWIRILGLHPPTSKSYDTFRDDPSLAYIEEVSGELSIKTSKGEFGEIIVARAAGRSNM